MRVIPRRTAGLALVLWACEPGGAAAPFWRIERDGRESFLLGTVHDGVEFDELPAAVTAALGRARLVIIEADLRSIDEQSFRQAITLPAGVSLRDQLAAPDWLALVDAFAGLYPPDELERTQPWFLQGLLASHWLPAEEPIDRTLVQRARAAGKDLGFLESWAEQIHMLNDLGVEDGLTGLMPMVRDPAGARVLLNAWLNAYRRGDLERLAELSFAAEDLAARPSYYGEIVFTRSWRWLALLEAELAAGGALVGVGFMHTLTDLGLPCLLERRGYRVVAVGTVARRNCR